MDKKIQKALQACPLFEGLTAEEIERALAGIPYRLVRYEYREVYALAGTPCRHADIIVSGGMTARMMGPSGKFVQMAAPAVGTLLAPAYIFSKDHALPVSIEAGKATEVLRMTPAMLKTLMDGDERIRMNFIRQLSTVGSFLAKKVKMLTLLSVREKVALFLLEEARRQGADTFVLDKSRQEIADSFAIQKYSLQRCLAEYARQGLIRVNGKTITLLDKRRVMVLANS